MDSNTAGVIMFAIFFLGSVGFMGFALWLEDRGPRK
jgi:hypothetical protein